MIRKKLILINSIGLLVGFFCSTAFCQSSGTFENLSISKIQVISANHSLWTTALWNYPGHAALVYSPTYTFAIRLPKDSDGTYKNLLAILLHAKEMGNNVNIEYYRPVNNDYYFFITGITEIFQ